MEIIENIRMSNPWAVVLVIETTGGGELTIPMDEVRYLGYNPVKKSNYIRVFANPEDHEYGISEDDYIQIQEVLRGKK